MTKSKKLETIANRWDSEISLLTWLATSISVFSFLFYFQRGEVLLYGDAIAHINIARRVFDSKTPGLLQLGTVWLPLPHLLMIPFIISMKMWRTGAGGSIPSMGAYVFGVAGIFRLTRDALSRGPSPDITAHLAAWFAAAVYAANPNLIYMQSTAMGESVYLAFFIWAVLYFLEATRGNPRSLTKCGLCLVGACLTRYDGWFLAAAMIAIVLLDSLRGERSLLRRNLFATDRVAGRDRRDPSDRPLQHRGRSGHAPDTLETPLQHRGRAALQGRVSHSNIQGALAPVLVKFVLLGALGPALWLAYNGIVYRNPLEFENGPYSAKAIEKRTQTGGNPGHPGSGSPVVAALYFSKAAQDNVAANAWLQRAWVLLLIVALVAAIYLWGTQQCGSTLAALLLLLIPLPFYALSIAYGGVPIFIPQWWPFTHYNVRYGLQLLPAFSFGLAVLLYAILHSSWELRLRSASALALLALVVASYASIWRVGPICLEEAEVNMRTRTQLERELATWLQRLPENATLLMYLGDHVGAVERAGIPLSHTINEGNHRVWKQPSDTDGLWERALAHPQQYADYVLAFEGDPVWQAVHQLHLRELVEIHVTGQAPAVLYRVR
ncbi:MAG: hypothetical protein WA485_02250 [Candidatus Sulfotelmatobacter sp.]